MKGFLLMSVFISVTRQPVFPISFWDNTVYGMCFEHNLKFKWQVRWEKVTYRIMSILKYLTWKLSYEVLSTSIYRHMCTCNGLPILTGHQEVGEVVATMREKCILQKWPLNFTYKSMKKTQNVGKNEFHHVENLADSLLLHNSLGFQRWNQSKMESNDFCL